MKTFKIGCVEFVSSIALAALIGLTGCGSSNEGCRSGSISVSNITSAAFAVSSTENALPEDFDYSAQEMRDAIVGTWVDSANSLTLVLEAPPEATIEYEVAGEGSKCMTTASLAVQGTLGKNGEATTIPVTGTFLGLLRLSDASLETTLGQAPNTTTSCYLKFTVANAPALSKLDGECEVPLSDLGTVALSFTK